jgi:hypothetical protein
MTNWQLARRAALAQHMRDEVRRRGMTPQGHRLWTEREDAIMRALYPDYRALRRRLRRRTYSSLRSRATTLGIVRHRHVWTAAEASRLRRQFPYATRQELLAAFPGLRWQQILGKARHLKLYKARKKLTRTGHDVLDDIRDRATSLGISMVDLDFLARTRKYFQKAVWYTHGKVSGAPVVKAIKTLGGRIRVEWD